MFQTLQRMFSGDTNTKNTAKKSNSGSSTKHQPNKVRPNNEDFSFIPITGTSSGLSTSEKGDSSYMNNMNSIINSQRVYSSSHRSKPEVQESDEVRLSTNSTQGQGGGSHSFEESMPKKKRKSRSQQSGTNNSKRSKSSKRKSLKSLTKKTPRRQNPGGGCRSTSKKRVSTSSNKNKSVSKRSRAKSNKRGGRPRKKK